MNGIVYRITCPNGKVYYGSTTTSLRERVWNHKCWSKRKPTLKVYEAILSVGWESVTIEVVEELKDITVVALRQAEQKWIDFTNPLCLNDSRAFRTEEERKQQVREATKQWRERNPDKVKEHAKKAWAARLPLTPEELEAKRAYHREYYMRKRRAAKS